MIRKFSMPVMLLVLVGAVCGAEDVDQVLFKKEETRPADDRGLARDYKLAFNDDDKAGSAPVNSGRKLDLVADYETPAKSRASTSDSTPYQLGDKPQKTADATTAPNDVDRVNEKPDDGNCCATGRYAKGTWGVNAYAGGYKPYTNGKSIFWGAVAGEYFVRDDLSVNVELLGYSLQQKNFSNAAGAGINALGRWHPLKSASERLAMYVEAGVGLADFSARTPGPNGRHFNGTIEAGIGGRFQFSDRLGLILGPRWFHISNGGTGSHGNPSINSIGGYSGISVKF